MYIFASISLVALYAVVLLVLPRRLLAGYRRCFAARHGTLFQIGTAVLATLILATIVLTLMRPGAAPVMERVDAAVTLIGTACAAWDLRAYALARRASDQEDSEG